MGCIIDADQGYGHRNGHGPTTVGYGPGGYGHRPGGYGYGYEQGDCENGQ